MLGWVSKTRGLMSVRTHLLSEVLPRPALRLGRDPALVHAVAGGVFGQYATPGNGSGGLETRLGEPGGGLRRRRRLLLRGMGRLPALVVVLGHLGVFLAVLQLLEAVVRPELEDFAIGLVLPGGLQSLEAVGCPHRRCRRRFVLSEGIEHGGEDD